MKQSLTIKFLNKFTDSQENSHKKWKQEELNSLKVHYKERYGLYAGFLPKNESGFVDQNLLTWHHIYPNAKLNDKANVTHPGLVRLGPSSKRRYKDPGIAITDPNYDTELGGGELTPRSIEIHNLIQQAIDTKFSKDSDRSSYFEEKLKKYLDETGFFFDTTTKNWELKSEASHVISDPRQWFVVSESLEAAIMDKNYLNDEEKNAIKAHLNPLLVTIHYATNINDEKFGGAWENETKGYNLTDLTEANLISIKLSGKTFNIWKEVDKILKGDGAFYVRGYTLNSMSKNRQMQNSINKIQLGTKATLENAINQNKWLTEKIDKERTDRLKEKIILNLWNDYKKLNKELEDLYKIKEINSTQLDTEGYQFNDKGTLDRILKAEKIVGECLPLEKKGQILLTIKIARITINKLFEKVKSEDPNAFKSGKKSRNTVNNKSIVNKKDFLAENLTAKSISETDQKIMAIVQKLIEPVAEIDKETQNSISMKNKQFLKVYMKPWYKNLKQGMRDAIKDVKYNPTEGSELSDQESMHLKWLEDTMSSVDIEALYNTPYEEQKVATEIQVSKKGDRTGHNSDQESMHLKWLEDTMSPVDIQALYNAPDEEQKVATEITLSKKNEHHRLGFNDKSNFIEETKEKQ